MAVTVTKGDGYAFYNNSLKPISEVPDGAEHIPLDGMNVVEWDLKKDGLENMPGYANHFRVLDVTDIDTSAGCLIRHFLFDYDTYTGEWTLSPCTFEAYDGFMRANGTAGSVIYVSNASEKYPSAGIYLERSDSTDGVRTFAYYPIASGNEETEPLSFIKFLVSPKQTCLPKNILGLKLAQKRGDS